MLKKIIKYLVIILVSAASILIVIILINRKPSDPNKILEYYKKRNVLPVIKPEYIDKFWIYTPKDIKEEKIKMTKDIVLYVLKCNEKILVKHYQIKKPAWGYTPHHYEPGIHYMNFVSSTLLENKRGFFGPKIKWGRNYLAIRPADGDKFKDVVVFERVKLDKEKIQIDVLRLRLGGKKGWFNTGFAVSPNDIFHPYPAKGCQMALGLGKEFHTLINDERIFYISGYFKFFRINKPAEVFLNPGSGRKIYLEAYRDVFYK
jgi:hypothetical protein